MRKYKIALIFIFLYSNIYCSINEEVIDTIEKFKGIFLDIPISIMQKIVKMNLTQLTDNGSYWDLVTGNFAWLGVSILLWFMVVEIAENGINGKLSIYKSIEGILMFFMKYFYVALFILNSGYLLYLSYGFVGVIIDEVFALLKSSLKMSSLVSVINSDIGVIWQILLSVYICSIYAIFTICIITIMARILKEKIALFWFEIIAPLYISMFANRKYFEEGLEFVLKYINSYVNIAKEILYLVFICNISGIISVIIKKYWTLSSVQYSVLVPTVSTLIGGLVVFFIGNGSYKIKKIVKEHFKKSEENEKNRKEAMKKNIVEGQKENILENISNTRGLGSIKEKMIRDFIDINYKEVTKTKIRKHFERKINSATPVVKMKEAKETTIKAVYNAKQTIIKINNVYTALNDIKNNNTSSIDFLKATNKIITEKITTEILNKKVRIKNNMSKYVFDKEKMKKLLNSLKNKRHGIYIMNMQKLKKDVKKTEKEINIEINKLSSYFKKEKYIGKEEEKREGEYRKFLETYESIKNLNYKLETDIYNKEKKERQSTLENEKREEKKGEIKDYKDINSNNIKEESKSGINNNENRNYQNIKRNKKNRENTKYNQVSQKTVEMRILNKNQKKLKEIEKLLKDNRVEKRKLEGQKRIVQHKIKSTKEKIEKKQIDLKYKKTKYQQAKNFKNILDQESVLINKTNDYLSELGQGERLVLTDTNKLL